MRSPNGKTVSLVLAASIFVSSVGMSPARSEAFLFHATKKAAAAKIMKQGFKFSRFKTKARFGKGLYAAKSRATALAEKGKTSAVIGLKSSRYAERKAIDLRNPTARKVWGLLGKIDLRGKIRNKVIGPKLGQQVGREAARSGRLIQYRSVKDGGTNIFIPKKVLRERPRIVRPAGLVTR